VCPADSPRHRPPRIHEIRSELASCLAAVPLQTRARLVTPARKFARQRKWATALLNGWSPSFQHARQNAVEESRTDSPWLIQACTQPHNQRAVAKLMSGKFRACANKKIPTNSMEARSMRRENIWERRFCATIRIFPVQVSVHHAFQRGILFEIPSAPLASLPPAETYSWKDEVNTSMPQRVSRSRLCTRRHPIRSSK